MFSPSCIVTDVVTRGVLKYEDFIDMILKIIVLMVNLAHLNLGVYYYC